MKSHVLGFWLAGSNLLLLLPSNPTIAQIAADETLIRNTVVRQQRNVTVIEGETSSGANLYSFGSFSVPTGATASEELQIIEFFLINPARRISRSIVNNSEQSRNVNSNNQKLIIKDLKSKISNSVIETNAWKVNKFGEVQLIASAPSLININNSVSTCTSDNTVRPNE